MNNYREHVIVCFCAMLAALASRSAAWAADPKVEVSDNPSVFIDGKHQYELKVTAGDQDVIGVIVVNGFTLFSLSAASPIKPPADWTFSPPSGPDADNLCYSSNKADADIKQQTMKNGFLFESSKAVTSFKVDLVMLGGSVQEFQADLPQPSPTPTVPPGGVDFSSKE